MKPNKKAATFKSVRATLVIDIETELDDSSEDGAQTLRYLVERFLEESDYTVFKCAVVDKNEVLKLFNRPRGKAGSPLPNDLKDKKLLAYKGRPEAASLPSRRSW